MLTPKVALSSLDLRNPKMSFSEHFSIKNIPYGIATSEDHPQRAVATRIGDHVIFLTDLDLSVAEELKKAIDQVGSLGVRVEGPLAKPTV